MGEKTTNRNNVTDIAGKKKSVPPAPWKILEDARSARELEVTSDRVTLEVRPKR